MNSRLFKVKNSTLIYLKDLKDLKKPYYTDGGTYGVVPSGSGVLHPQGRILYSPLSFSTP